MGSQQGSDREEYTNETYYYLYCGKPRVETRRVGTEVQLRINLDLFNKVLSDIKYCEPNGIRAFWAYQIFYNIEVVNN